MSDAMKVEVYQGSYPYVGDGVQKFARGNRRGEIVTPDWMTQLAIEGRMFCVSNATKGTALAAGGTSYSDTAPAFTIDVPANYTMVPMEILLKQGGTVAGAVVTVLLTYDNKIRHASGGTALTVGAMRSDAPYSSGCSAYTGDTAAAAALQRTFWASLIMPDVSGTADVSFPGFEQFCGWSAKDHVPPVLVGPASLVIYSYAGTTQPSWFYTFTWLEMASSLLT